jgi:hypothetical protein
MLMNTVVNDMTKNETKFQKTLQAFSMLQENVITEIKKLLEAGVLTPAMLEFDFDEGDIEIETNYQVVYPNGDKDVVTKTFLLNLNIIVREA